MKSTLYGACAALFIAALTAPPAIAQSTYKCGNTYQQTPCDNRTQQPGAAVRIFKDQVSDTDIFNAEARRLREWPQVAKYPMLYYATGADMWQGLRVSEGKSHPVSVPMDDPDVLRVNARLRGDRMQQQTQEAQAQQQRGSADRTDRSDRYRDLERARRDAVNTCRAYPAGSAYCWDAKQAVEKAEKAYRATGRAN